MTKNRIGPRTIYKTLKFNSAALGKSIPSRHLLGNLVDGKTKISIEKGAQLEIKGNLEMGINPENFFPSNAPCILTMGENSRIIFHGNINIGRGVIIEAQRNATIEFGKNVCINSNATIIASQSIKIGDSTGIGWNSEIIDTDYHGMLNTIGDVKVAGPIEIGSHVFIARHVYIMKGIKIGDGSIIGAGAIVTHDVPPNCLAGGIPAKIIKENIQWK
ncbi:MAG: acyltransferase [Candidatus Bathyarchaeota archaeon]|nr:acyltransferase [Candidatus Bathyarchaeota archaeon]